MTERLNLVMQLNPEFAEALARGERWATKHTEAVKGLDGQASRRFPERDFEPQGSKNWCGSCPFADGCVNCDLPYRHDMKDMVGTIATYKVTCSVCLFRRVSDEVGQDEAKASAQRYHHQHTRNCRGVLTARRT